MGTHLVHQPNGLLARFSTVADDFTDYDMTVMEAVQSMLADRGYREAWKEVVDAMRDKPRQGVAAREDRLSRWNEALSDLAFRAGRKAARAAVAMCRPAVQQHFECVVTEVDGNGVARVEMSDLTDLTRAEEYASIDVVPLPEIRVGDVLDWYIDSATGESRIEKRDYGTWTAEDVRRMRAPKREPA